MHRARLFFFCLVAARRRASSRVVAHRPPAAAQTKKLRARVRGQRYTNPYDSRYRANWEFVFGRWDRYGVARAVFVPSRRAAHWPPWSEESAARNHRRSGGIERTGIESVRLGWTSSSDTSEPPSLT